MSYALVIPGPLVREMYVIREQTGISIRAQILRAIEAYIDGREHQKSDHGDRSALTFKQIDEGTFGASNPKTGRFHDTKTGVDVVF